MAEENNINVYLTSIQKMIRSGSPKYMSYISKQYMKYKNTSPIITETIEDMIKKSVNINPQSPYAVFLDKDGSMSLEAMDNISKISNLPEFISQVQELSKYGIDFQEVSSDDLIIEGDEMAEELAKELEEMDNMSEQEQESVKSKAGETVVKLTGLALIGGAIGSRAKGLLARIKETLAKMTGKKPKEISGKNDPEQERLERIETGKKNMASNKSFEDVCPRQEVDEYKALHPDSIDGKDDNTKMKIVDTYGDGDPDGDNLDL